MLQGTLAEMGLFIVRIPKNYYIIYETSEHWSKQSSYRLWKKKILMIRLISIRRKPDHLGSGISCRRPCSLGQSAPAAAEGQNEAI